MIHSMIDILWHVEQSIWNWENWCVRFWCISAESERRRTSIHCQPPQSYASKTRRALAAVHIHTRRSWMGEHHSMSLKCALYWHWYWLILIDIDTDTDWYWLILMLILIDTDTDINTILWLWYFVLFLATIWRILFGKQRLHARSPNVISQTFRVHVWSGTSR